MPRCARHTSFVRPALVAIAVTALGLATLGAGTAHAAPEPEQSPFRTWTAQLWPDARAAGVSRRTFETATADLSLDRSIIERLNNQPEFSKSVGDYFKGAVSAKRIANGRAKLAQHGDLLAQIEARYGVDRHVLTAIWGVESSYGDNLGRRNVIASLATLGFAGERRARFGRQQLIAALAILERETLPPGDMIGSWAGAMGQTQFIPTTFRAFAVDFDGDGKRDLWNSVADSVGSAANYLAESGWVRGKRWGFEVRLPNGFDYALTGRSTRKSVAAWRALGVKPAVDPKAPEGTAAPGFDETDEGSILLPSGARGPAFLILRNFNVILRYNQASSYALAVGHLSDRLRGGPALVAPWPPNDRPLTRTQRITLQERLTAKGHDTGGIDGIIGPMSRRAIRSAQVALGMVPDGYPTQELLAALAPEQTQAPATASAPSTPD